MVLTWNLDDDRASSLSEVIEFFEARGPKPLSGHDLAESATVMRRLYNDRQSVCAHIDEHYRQFLRFDRADYAPDAIVLHRARHFLVRAVIWLPDGIKGQRSNVRDIRIHDHNFNFMTLGLYGPGYQTEVWEYDHEVGRNLVGTEVPVRHQRMLQLEERQVFYFRSSLDIHRQLPPTRMSVSLNIMELADQPNLQYEFAEPASLTPEHLFASCALNPPLVQHLCAILAGSPLQANAARVLEMAGAHRDAEFNRRVVAPAMALLQR